MKIKQLHEYENGVAIDLAPVTIPNAVVNPDTQENLTDALERIEESIPTKVSELENDKGYLTSHQSISHLATKTELSEGLSGKQGTISDLDTIRSGAAKGATALQSVPSEYVTESELSAKGYATVSSVNSSVSSLQSQINTLVSGDASSAIESFNEITAFLDGVNDTETLDGIIAGINAEIAKKAGKDVVITGITRSGTTFTATRADGTTFTFTQQDTNTTYSFSGGTNKFTVTPSGGTAQDVTITPSISNNVTYSGTLTSGQVAVLDGTAGKIKASGYTIATSVPSGAKFTDTDTKVTSVGNHYTPAEDTGAAISAASGAATNITGTAGKLNVVTGVKRDAKGHIVGVTSANIYSTDNNTTYSSKSAASGGTDVSLVTTGEKYTWNAKASTATATTSANGLMSASDKTKLNGIASGATAVSESTVSGWGFTKNAGTITGIKMNGTSKGTSGVVDLGTVITAHQDISGKQDKVLKFTNLTASSWTSDTTYADFPYRCDVATSGVTSSMFAEVVFSLAQASSGDYAPICETKSGAVSVWSKKNVSITIPTILITK